METVKFHAAIVVTYTDMGSKVVWPNWIDSIKALREYADGWSDVVKVTQVLVLIQYVNDAGLIIGHETYNAKG